MQIRPATAHDDDAIWRIIGPVIASGETYALPRDWTRDEALAFWRAPGHAVFVAEDKGAIVGTYYLQANQRGGGAHVANCGYVTAVEATGRGVAFAMCIHSLDVARARGFRAMQFNLVGIHQRARGAIVGTLRLRHRRPAAGCLRSSAPRPGGRPGDVSSALIGSIADARTAKRTSLRAGGEAIQVWIAAAASRPRDDGGMSRNRKILLARPLRFTLDETKDVRGMKAREVIRLLEQEGWVLVATRGSHRQYKHALKPGRVTVAGKPSDDLAPGTLNSILKQAGLKEMR